MKYFLRGLIAIIVSLCWCFFVQAGGISDFQVTFKTTDCNGEEGLASVNVDKIYRIQSFQCGFGNQLQLKQVLVKSDSGISNYDIFTIRSEEVERIEKGIKSCMDARRKALEKGTSIVIEESSGEKPQPDTANFN
jgi:hypothetical protein